MKFSFKITGHPVTISQVIFMQAIMPFSSNYIVLSYSTARILNNRTPRVSEYIQQENTHEKQEKTEKEKCTKIKIFCFSVNPYYPLCRQG